MHGTANRFSDVFDDPAVVYIAIAEEAYGVSLTDGLVVGLCLCHCNDGPAPPDQYFLSFLYFTN